MRNSHLSEPFHQLAIHQTCQVCHTPNAIRYIHCAYGHIFPLTSSTLLSSLLQTISSIVQGQDSSSGLSQGSTLCRTWVKASSSGNLPPPSTEPAPWIHPEHTGNHQEPPDQISVLQKAINQTNPKHTKKGSTHMSEEAQKRKNQFLPLGIDTCSLPLTGLNQSHPLFLKCG